jgi:hypothetical protein
MTTSWLGELAPLRLSIEDVARKALVAGWRGDALVTAVAICGAETAGTYDAHILGDVDLTERYEVSVGLWQINFRPSRDGKRENGILIARDPNREPKSNLDPDTNARHAYSISGGGNNWKPWSTYNNGDYKKFLAVARAAALRIAAIPRSPAKPVSAPVSDASGLAYVYDTPPPTGPELPIFIGADFLPGKSAIGDKVSPAVVGGSVDMTTTKVSELSLELSDPGLRLQQHYSINVGSPLRFRGLRWQVVELTIKQGPADEHVVIRAHPRGLVHLRTSSPAADHLTPGEYVKKLAQSVGLGFVGEAGGASTGAAIGPTLVTDNSGRVAAQRMETSYEVAMRLAKDAGYLLFEAAGTLYFGSPRYLATQGEKVQISHRGHAFSAAAAAGAVVQCLETPTCSASRRAYHSVGTSPGVAGTTITYATAVDMLHDINVRARVERTRGEHLRPGMSVALAGVGPFDGGGLLLSRVGWSLNDLTSPVDVEFGTAQELPTAESSADTAPGAPFGPVDVSLDTDLPPRMSEAGNIRWFGPPGDIGRTVSWRTPWGIEVRLHHLILEQFKAACFEAKQRSKWVPRRIDSYNKRKIANSNEWSLHSFGLAFDFFDTPAPTSIKGQTNAPDIQFRDAFQSVGFYPGARFRHNPDYPHIEWASGPPIHPPVN